MFFHFYNLIQMLGFELQDRLKAKNAFFITFIT